MSEKPAGVYEVMKLHALMEDPVCRELQSQLAEKENQLKAAEAEIKELKNVDNRFMEVNALRQYELSLMEELKTKLQKAKEALEKIIDINEWADERNQTLHLQITFCDFCESQRIAKEAIKSIDQEGRG